MGASLRRVPPWAWLGCLVLASFAFRAWLARGMVGPIVLFDEIVYSELAKSFAASREFLIRDVPSSGYGAVYPLLLSPAYAAFDSLVDAYAAVKTINALVMSLAAVPAYLIARRVVGPWLSLLCAVLAVSIPSLVYTGTVMTENVFYPVFLGAVLVLVVALERPTAWWQLAVLAAIGVATATRLQAVVLLAGALCAPPLLALFRREPVLGVVGRFRWLYGLTLAGGALVVVLQLARGRELSSLLGGYRPVAETGYEPAEVLRYLGYHVAELDIYLGIFPVAAAIVLVACARSLDRPLQALLAATLAVSFWLLLTVSAFASVFVPRIEERNMFFVAPLFFALLLAWIERGAPRPRLVAPIAAAVAAGLVLLIPFERFIDISATTDTLIMLPLWSVQDRIGADWISWLVLGLAVAAACAFLLVPRRLGLALPLAVLVFYAAVLQQVWSGPHGWTTASEAFTRQGIAGERDWIDAEVDGSGSVAVLWTGRSDRFTVNHNEFFNRAVGRVYYTDAPTPGGVGELRVEAGPDGVLRLEDGSPVEAEYLLTDRSHAPAGELVARDDAIGTSVWRVGGTASLASQVSGLYPNDTWSGKAVTWKGWRCRGGELWVWLSSDPTLFDGEQTVTATHAGRTFRAILDPGESAPLRVPLVDGASSCAVRFAVGPTAVPAEVIPGSGDTRELGVRFDLVVHRPAP